jgi:hypothetical protein
MRVCKKCGIEKSLDDFPRHNVGGKIYYEHTCKECVKEVQRKRSIKHYEINRETMIERSAKHYQDNKEAHLQYSKQYQEDNKDELKQYFKAYYEDNKEEKLEYQKEYYETNKKVIISSQNKREKKRRASDPAFALRKNCSRAIIRALKGLKNGASILEYLPYTMEELKQHLEKQFDNKMSWTNYGTYWHVDHIIPQSLLPYTSMEDDNFKKCWALENLQPLEAIENIKKSNKILK